MPSDPQPATVQRVAVGIPTFHRPQGLERLLQSLSGLRFDTIRPPELCVIVVDNDPQGSGGAVVEAARTRLPWPVRYAVEPRPGIAHARNRIVALAGELAMDFIAFIDDDEEATPEWLEHLLRLQTRHNASMVSGPVFPAYPPGTPPWVVESGFFQEKQFVEGTTPGWGCTCNLLIDRRMLAAMAGPFEPRLGLTGGSDTHLFIRIRQSPAWKWVWAPRAIVVEHIPEERAKLSWMLKRRFRYGNSQALIEQHLHPSGMWRLRMVYKALDALLYSLILLPRGIRRGRTGWLEPAGFVMQSLGLFAGILGYRYCPYGKR